MTRKRQGVAVLPFEAKNVSDERDQGKGSIKGAKRPNLRLAFY